jgi:hypothetical protein
VNSLVHEIERGADLTRDMVTAALAPWGGPELCIDAYETTVRAVSDMHMTVAKAFDLGPARSFAARCASFTRDIGATQVSAARWFLEA